MAHTPRGFTGTVDQIAEAGRFALAGVRFRVNTASDWGLSVVAGIDRTIRIESGFASACGVTDLTTSAETVTFAPNTSGVTRYDALVASWDWASRLITFRAVPGSSVPPVVLSTGLVADLGKINRIPGVRYDALLAIVPVTNGVGTFPTTGGNAFTDCRPWGGYTGPLVIGQTSSTGNNYLSMLDLPYGSEVFVGSRRYTLTNVWNTPYLGVGLTPFTLNNPLDEGGTGCHYYITPDREAYVWIHALWSVGWSPGTIVCTLPAPARPIRETWGVATFGGISPREWRFQTDGQVIDVFGGGQGSANAGVLTLNYPAVG